MNRAIIKSFSTTGRSFVTKVRPTEFSQNSILRKGVTTEFSQNSILRERVIMLENKIDRIEKLIEKDKEKDFLYSCVCSILCVGAIVYLKIKN